MHEQDVSSVSDTGDSEEKKQDLSKAVEPTTSIVFPRAVIHGDISTIGLKTCCKMRNNYPVKSLGTDFRNTLPHL